MTEETEELRIERCRVLNLAFKLKPELVSALEQLEDADVESWAQEAFQSAPSWLLARLRAVRAGWDFNPKLRGTGGYSYQWDGVIADDLYLPLNVPVIELEGPLFRRGHSETREQAEERMMRAARVQIRVYLDQRFGRPDRKPRDLVRGALRAVRNRVLRVGPEQIARDEELASTGSLGTARQTVWHAIERYCAFIGWR